MEQSITGNIVLQSIKKVSRRGMFQKPEAGKWAAHWIERLRIKTRDVENPVSTLSGGNQQKVVLARNLMSAPKLLILNCPTVGVDIGSKMEISALIQQVAGEGMAVILISDDPGEILTNCRRFFMMKNGEIHREYKSSDYTDSTLYAELVR